LSIFNELKRRNVFKVGIAYVIVAWLVAQVLQLVFESFGTPDWAIKTVLVLLATGLPFALFFAWAFEMTPEGIKREHEVDRSQSIAPQTGSKLNLTIIVLMALALAYFSYDKFVLSGDREAALLEAATQVIAEQAATSDGAPAPNKSIAVLPFANLSSDPEQEYFSEGMTEEIISKLARIGNLQVASRTSVLRFRETELDIREIATTLGVRYILEGSVRKAGDQLRITAQLIDSENGFHVWSKDFDGSLKDIFDVQESTAMQIADALDIHLSPQERDAVQRRYISNNDAYDAYLRGQAFIMNWGEIESLMAAREQFEKALELEPDYPPALAGLAGTEAQIYRNHDPDEARLIRGTELANRALALDPSLVRGHMALGELAADRYDYRGATGRFRKAVTIEPDNALAWDYLSWSLAYQHPPDPIGAEEAARKAILLAPEFGNAYYHLGRALNLQGRFDEAIAAFKQIYKYRPNSSIAHLGITQSYLAQGNLEQARKYSVLSMQVAGQSPIELSLSCFIEAADGNNEAALECLEELLGDKNYRDFEALDNSVHLQALRADPRYQALLDKYR
jgi:TolB-like protein/Tfp pilus assembly protein PilF